MLFASKCPFNTAMVHGPSVSPAQHHTTPQTTKRQYSTTPLTTKRPTFLSTPFMTYASYVHTPICWPLTFTVLIIPFGRVNVKVQIIHAILHAIPRERVPQVIFVGRVIKNKFIFGNAVVVGWVAVHGFKQLSVDKCK